MSASIERLSIAEITNEYLNAWKEKNTDAIAELIHPEVHFKGPMTEFEGKDQFLAACQRMFPMLREFRVRSIAALENQVIAIYDFVCIEPIGVCRTAELITFDEDLIRDVELFFDARPFEKFAQAKRSN